MGVLLDVDDESLLNPDSKNVSAGCIYVGDPQSLFGFEHWCEDIWGAADSVNGDVNVDVSNLDYQPDPPLSLDILPASPPAMQPEYCQGEDFNPHFLQTVFPSDNFLESTNARPQRSSGRGFEWLERLSLPLDPNSVLPLIEGEENESKYLSHLPWPCTNSQPNSLNAKDNRLAVSAETNTALGESRFGGSSLDTTTSGQIWACDYQKCGRIYQSHKKLRQHKRYHNRSHVCREEECLCKDIRFTSRKDLARHHESIHLGISVKCTQCGKKIKRKDNLRRHITTCHHQSAV